MITGFSWSGFNPSERRKKKCKRSVNGEGGWGGAAEAVWMGC